MTTTDQLHPPEIVGVVLWDTSDPHDEYLQNLPDELQELYTWIATQREEWPCPMPVAEPEDDTPELTWCMMPGLGVVALASPEGEERRYLSLRGWRYNEAVTRWDILEEYREQYDGIGLGFGCWNCMTAGSCDDDAKGGDTSNDPPWLNEGDEVYIDIGTGVEIWAKQTPRTKETA